MNLLMAVLEKRCGVQLSGCDAYVNIAGGMKVQEPAIDLAIVLAALSSFKNREISPRLVAFGEVGLSGEVRSVSMANQRVAEARKLGFDTCILPAVCMKGLKSDERMRLIGVRTIQDAVNAVL